jgi:hypothetical protein
MSALLGIKIIFVFFPGETFYIGYAEQGSIEGCMFLGENE